MIIRVSQSGLSRAPRLAFAFVATAMMLAGCADKRGGPIPYDAGRFGAPDAPTVATIESDYTIAPLDTVTVKVFKMPELSGDYEIDLAGQLSMPLIGNVPAAELTTAQLDQRLPGPPDTGEVHAGQVAEVMGVDVAERQPVARRVTLVLGVRHVEPVDDLAQLGDPLGRCGALAALLPRLVQRARDSVGGTPRR